MADWTVGTQYTPVNFTRTGQAPGTVYENPDWGIGPGNPGTLKEIRDIGGTQYGDFQFATGSGWAPLSPIQLSAPAPAQATQPTAQTLTTQVAPPTQSSQVSPYLSTIQEGLAKLLESSEVGLKTDDELMSEITAAVLPGTPPPEVPDLSNMWTELGEQYGIADLQDQVTYWDNYSNDLKDQLFGETLTEKGKPVAMGVIGGRIGQHESEAMIRINFASNQKNRAVNALNMANSTISTIMNLTQQDYTNAANAYNTQFNQNLQLYNTFQTAKNTQWEQNFQIATTAMDYSMELFKLEQDAIQQDKANATANLGIYADLISTGKMSYDSLNAGTKLAINQMELTSGLGVGFLSRITASNPTGEIMTTTTRQDASGMKFADTLIRMPDGSIRVQTTSLGQELLPEYASGGSGSSGKTGLTQTQQNKLVDEAKKILVNEDVLGRIKAGNAPEDWDQKEDDYKMSEEEMRAARDRVIAYVGDEELGKEIFNQAWNYGGFELWVDPKAMTPREVEVRNRKYF